MCSEAIASSSILSPLIASLAILALVTFASRMLAVSTASAARCSEAIASSSILSPLIASLAILALVTFASRIFAVTTASSAILALVTDEPDNLAVVTARSAIFAVVTFESAILAVTTPESGILRVSESISIVLPSTSIARLTVPPSETEPPPLKPSPAVTVIALFASLR